MNLTDVAAEVTLLIAKETGLDAYYELNHASSFRVIAVSKGLDLGYISVTKLIDGKYMIAGTSAGCFSYNTPRSIMNHLKYKFKEIENKVNGLNNVTKGNLT